MNQQLAKLTTQFSQNQLGDEEKETLVVERKEDLSGLPDEMVSGAAKKGKRAIVNVSAMVADYGAPGMSLYGSSKAAINLLTKDWAAEYGPRGVRLNAVSPGPSRTEGTDVMGEDLEELKAQATGRTHGYTG